jgi:hypothetical protein
LEWLFLALRLAEFVDWPAGAGVVTFAPIFAVDFVEALVAVFLFGGITGKKITTARQGRFRL